jgi:hypothetical protein
VRKTYLLSVFLSNSTPRKPPYLCIEGIGEEGYLFCIFFFLRPLSLFYTVERVEEEDGGAKHTQMFIIYTHTHTHSIQGVVLFAFVRVFMYSLLLALCLLLFWDILITQSIVLASTGAALQDKLLLYCRLLL